MIDLKEIEETIREYEEADTSIRQCEILAALYAVRDRHKTPTIKAVEVEPEHITEATEGSEFMEASSGVSYKALMEILNEHMEAMRVVHPKEYDSVMMKIRELR